MGNICINDLDDYVILVDGKTKSCLYDLRNKKLYHINHRLSKLIQKVKYIPTTYLSLDEINIIQDLNNNGIDLSNIVTVEELRKSVSLLSIPWWRSHPIHKNRATESIWTEPCNPLLRAAKSTKRATFNL